MGLTYRGEPGDDRIDGARELRYLAVQEASEDFGSRRYLLAAQAGVEQAE